MVATLAEIAQEAGVSTTTVSRLLRGDKTFRISDEKYKKIMKVKERLGGLRSGRGYPSPSLAHHIVAPLDYDYLGELAFSTPAYEFFIKAVEAALKKAGFRFSIALFDSENKMNVIRDLINDPNYCDGLLFVLGVIDEKAAGLLLERSFPHVCIDMDNVAERMGVNTVSNYSLGGYNQAVAHLTQLGHRRIGYLGPKPFRYPTYLSAMAQVNLPVDPSYDCEIIPREGKKPETYWRDLAREAFGRWIDRGRVATAMICHNDAGALGAVDAMKERGLVPGKDISIVGYDNLEQRRPDPVEHPILTTIDNPVDLRGQRCGEFLLNQILQKQHQIVHEHIPVSLIIRETTGPCQQNQSS